MKYKLEAGVAKLHVGEERRGEENRGAYMCTGLIKLQYLDVVQCE